MLENHRYQHPVGQGFFHSGLLTVGRGRFRYVYDCGSFNREPLQREIRRYARAVDADSGWIHALFISHFDADHVNGLDTLMAIVPVRTVVIPYLDPLERLMAAATTIESGDADASYLELVANPVAWFSARGADRVIQILGSDGDDRGPVGIDDFRPDAGGVDLIDLVVDASYVNHPTQAGRGSDGADVEQIRDVTPLGVAENGAQINWAFVTFVHPEPPRVAGFGACLERKIGLCRNSIGGATSSIDPRALVKAVADHRTRAVIVDCYKHIRKDRNLTSMSLYSGPLCDDPLGYPSWDARSECLDWPWLPDVATLRPLWSRGNSAACGWLGTGDAGLKASSRRDAFLQHYAALLPKVVTMTLPHHGSRHNFHPDLLEHALVFVASAGEDSRFGHPHREVIAAVTKDGRIPVLTTEYRPTGLREWCRVPASV